jgi:8-oxo-dGTP pyrophosphatase MutT (NUDIX family)
MVDGRHVGWVMPDFAVALSRFPHVFHVNDVTVSLQPRLADFASRSAAVAEVMAALRDEGAIPGWRNELYAVAQGFHEKPLLQVERAATPLFGTLAYGVNLNGFVGRGWETRLWIARRAETKPVDPGMLDIVVGGGQPTDISPWDNLMKECREEAGLPLELAARARPTGLITLVALIAGHMRIGLQFNYDLELPADFRPRNTDGEVAEFMLMPINEVIERLKTPPKTPGDEFSYDIAIVLIDFLVRHGFVGPEDSDYLDLIANLRRPIPWAA